jgi:hypothetical protein
MSMSRTERVALDLNAPLKRPQEVISVVHPVVLAFEVCVAKW